MDDTRVRYEELEDLIGKEIFMLCVGRISPIQITKIEKKPKNDHIYIHYYDLTYSLTTCIHAEDFGVIGCPGDYGNFLNGLFKDQQDAFQYREAFEYKQVLQEHLDFCIPILFDD